MNIIPVIDLLDGLAVHARLGRRECYRPLHSPLCNHGEVLSLVRHLAEDFQFSTLYVADLNAILNRGNNFALLSSIIAAFPNLTIWIDAGFRDNTTLNKLAMHFPVTPVIGTETWYAPMRIDCDRYVLSLDRDDDGWHDLSGLHARPEYWPDNVILMNLARVGSGQGPDHAQLSAYRSRFPNKQYYAAGGVRNHSDLKKLEKAGASGVLLASALHKGQVSANDILDFG